MLMQIAFWRSNWPTKALAVAILAPLLLGGAMCETTKDGGAPKPVNPYLALLINQTVVTIQSLVELYGGLPTEAAEVVVDVRAYGDAMCAVMAVEGLTPEQRLIELQTALAEPRQKLDAAYAKLGLVADKLEPGVYVAAKNAVGLARGVGDLLVTQEVDPEQFEAPCATLARVPPILAA